MGQAAVPLQIVTAIAGTALSVSSSKRSAQIQAAQMEQRRRQAAAEARSRELQRSKVFRKTTGMNLAKMAAGGLAIEGNLASILEGNVTSFEQDLKLNQLSSQAQQANYLQAGKDIISAGNIQAAGGLISGIGQLANIYSDVKKTSVPTTPTGNITGVSK